MALRTQQIIACESGVPNTVDPVAGSYAIEARTNAIEREASALLQRIDAVGGTLAAITAGTIQAEIQEAAFRTQQSIDAGSSIVIGVNRFQSDGEDAAPPIPILRIDPSLERVQRNRVRALRATRDEGVWSAALEQVGAAARDGSNLVPPIIAAVEARATVGEVADVLRKVFGEYREAN